MECFVYNVWTLSLLELTALWRETHISYKQEPLQTCWSPAVSYTVVLHMSVISKSPSTLHTLEKEFIKHLLSFEYYNIYIECNRCLLVLIQLCLLSVFVTFSPFSFLDTRPFSDFVTWFFFTTSSICTLFFTTKSGEQGANVDGNSHLPSDVWASHHISKANPSQSPEKANFSSLYPWPCPFSHELCIVTKRTRSRQPLKGEGRNAEKNSKYIFLQHNGPVQRLQYHKCCFKPPVHLTHHPPVSCDQEAKIPELLGLGQ